MFYVVTEFGFLWLHIFVRGAVNARHENCSQFSRSENASKIIARHFYLCYFPHIDIIRFIDFRFCNVRQYFFSYNCTIFSVNYPVVFTVMLITNCSISYSCFIVAKYPCSYLQSFIFLYLLLIRI